MKSRAQSRCARPLRDSRTPAAGPVLAAIAAAILWSPPAQAADPTVADCLAATEASLKSGNEHHLRTERNQLLVCTAATCPADIRKECVRRIEDVNAAMPTILFEAKDAAGNDLSAVKVTMDGERIAERLEGMSLSIDPGLHVFVFETAGQPPVTKRFVIREAQKDRREAIVFGGLRAAGGGPQDASTGGAPTPASQAPFSAPPPEDTKDGLGTQKVVALIAGGLGVAGLAAGSAFGLAAISKKSQAQASCPDLCSTQSAVDAWSDAKAEGNVSTALFVVGGVALAGAVVLWVTAPTPSAGATARIGLGPRGLRLEGTW
jgi:hypothetical protein